MLVSMKPKYDHLLGKKVRVTDSFGHSQVGILESLSVDWQCDLFGQTIYIVNSGELASYVETSDRVEEFSDEDN